MSARPLPPVEVRGRELRAGGERFVPYGFNYTGSHPDGMWALRYFDHPSESRYRTVRGHFEKARRLGANSLRIFVELPQVMRSAERLNHRTLGALERVLAMAERKRVYVDITGNLLWRPSRRAAWYDALAEQARWRVQARFWSAVAEVARPFRSVLCYELTSEPAIPPTARKEWYAGRLGGYDFVQRIVRQPRKRDPHDLARRWTRMLASAVRSRDDRHPVGIGLLPMTDWAFDPANVAPLLDVLVLHEYPRSNRPDESVALVRYFASHGRPVIVGETAQLYARGPTQRRFLLDSRRHAAGYLSFFDGRRPEDVRLASDDDEVYLFTLKQFLGLRSELIG